MPNMSRVYRNIPRWVAKAVMSVVVSSRANWW